jgi:hypothetical protein
MATIKKAQQGNRVPNPMDRRKEIDPVRPGRLPKGDTTRQKITRPIEIDPVRPGRLPKGTAARKIMKSGGSTPLGMKSVIAKRDRNPGVTRTDIILAAKKEAKGGVKLKKQAAIAIAMKKAGKSPKKARGGATLSPSSSSVSKRLSSYPKTIGKAQLGGLFGQRTGVTPRSVRKQAKKALRAVRSPRRFAGGGSMKTCRGGCY